MRLLPACYVFIASAIRKNIFGLAALGLLLSLGAFPVWGQGTQQTFAVSVSNWSFVAGDGLIPIDPSSTITIDTAAGQVVSSNLTVGSGILLSFTSQQPAGTGTVLQFNASNVTYHGLPTNITIIIGLPTSLVGFTGAPMCNGLGSCSGYTGPGSEETWFDLQNPLIGGGGEVGTGQVGSTGQDFSISAQNPTVTVQAGQSASYTIAVSGSGGFNSAVQLSASNLPPNTTASFSPVTVFPNPFAPVLSTLTVSTTSTTPLGQSTFTVAGTSGLPLVFHSTTLTLNVTAPPKFAVNVTPQNQTVSLGNPAKFQGTITPAPGFTGTVSLSALGLPAGTNIEFDPAQVTNGSGSFEFTIAANSKAVPGTYAVTIVGANPAETHGATINLTVQ